MSVYGRKKYYAQQRPTLRWRAARLGALLLLLCGTSREILGGPPSSPDTTKTPCRAAPSPETRASPSSAGTLLSTVMLLAIIVTTTWLRTGVAHDIVRRRHCVFYPAGYFWLTRAQKRCQAPARSQHAPLPWALPAAARRPRAGCPGERPPPLAPQHPLPAHGRRASPRSRASRRFADATVYPRSLAIESHDPIFRVAEVCLHPLPKAHALWREKVTAAAAAISH